MSRLIVAALAASLLPPVGVVAQPSQTGARRFFTIAAVEPRGGANVSQEALPAEPLPAGGGYVLRQADQTGRWEVSTYLWSTNQIVVH